jgi:hypothetical protein
MASASHSDERLPDCARDDLALREGLQPIIGIILKLGAGPAPGADATEDASWAASVALARRNVLAHQAAGIDNGLAADNLRLLDRIDSMIGVWPDEDWDDLARRRVQELVDGGGEAVSAAGSFARAVSTPSRRTISTSGGCCATQQITICAGRPERSQTRRAAC